MNCGRVKALLSAYLDNELALEDRQSVSSHLPSCAACSALHAAFRRFDALLSRLPHVEPQLSLRDRIFSSSEYKMLAGIPCNASDSHSSRASSWSLLDNSRHSKFVSIPTRALRKTSEVHRVFVIPLPYRRSSMILRIMQVAIITCFLLTLSVSGFIGYCLWQKQVQSTHTIPAILQHHQSLYGHKNYYCYRCHR